MRALVAGWFSFELMGATAGDLRARDTACAWLEAAGCPYDVAVAPPFDGGVDWRAVEPADYTHVLFVCGPFGDGEPVTDLLSRFEGRRFAGLGLSMLQPLEEFEPFDFLLPRDSSDGASPDLSLSAPERAVPVVGVALVHPQREYDRPMHDVAHAAIERVLASRELAPVRIDTRLDVPNEGGLRTPAAVESLVARMDAMVTTRLHGGVLALRHGVPVLWVDPIGGGAKIARQAETLGWPAVVTADRLDDGRLAVLLDWCLGAEAREVAAACAERGAARLGEERERFVAWMREG
jgi:polysaccharide pyruvyl transferase